MKISVVIPTRNRAASLERVLLCLTSQTKPAQEIIVIDSSDDKIELKRIKEKFSSLPLIFIDSIASVCIQRNIGIQRASCDWVFLCDDDMEFESNYLALLATFALKQKCGAVSGLWMQYENDRWVSQYPVKNFQVLLWRYLFQQSIWGDIKTIKVHPLLKKLNSHILYFYKKRGNTTTLAGWPLITEQSDLDYFITKIYSLGASIVRRDWLINSPYNEVLDASGIGDNYGVEMGFPHQTSIYVLSSALVYHHRANENRLSKILSYYRRVLALHCFIKIKNDRVFNSTNWFIWSLFGNVLVYVSKGEIAMARATLKAMLLILADRNPYWLAHKVGSKITQPFP